MHEATGDGTKGVVRQRELGWHHRRMRWKEAHCGLGRECNGKASRYGAGDRHQQFFLQAPLPELCPKKCEHQQGNTGIGHLKFRTRIVTHAWPSHRE
jgi:hypothetical protein